MTFGEGTPVELKLEIGLGITVDDSGVSFNKLLHEVSRCLGMLGPRITTEIIHACQDHLIENACQEKAPEHLVRHCRKNEPGQYCLRVDPFTRKGFRTKPRYLLTNLGDVAFKVQFLSCRTCGHRETPILKFLKLDQYQSHSGTLEKMLMEVIAKETYRDGVARIEGIADVPVPKSTAHRWVLESEAANIDPPPTNLESLMADSTKVKMEGGKKGDLRAAIGFDEGGRLQPLGTWMGKDWSEIEANLAQQMLHQKRKPKILVSDGETGLDDHLSSLAEHAQRSHWHLQRDLRVIMWRDGLSKEAVEPYRDRLQSILGIEIPAEDYQAVAPSDKKALEEKIETAKKEFRAMVDEFAQRGYAHASTYLENALSKVFTHVELWLKIGYLAPKTTSVLENVMRALGKRLKKFAYNWSDRGAEKVARIILKRLPTEAQWKAYWHRILCLSDECSIRINYCRLAA